MKTPWKKKFKKLLAPETWLRPKSLIYVVIAWLVIQASNLLFEWAKLELDMRFKAVNVTAEFANVEFCEAANLDTVSKSHEVGQFNRDLDDDILTNYAVIPIKLRNSTRSAIASVSFSVDMGTQKAKILDVKSAMRKPTRKVSRFRHNLPNANWFFPSNEFSAIRVRTSTPEMRVYGYNSMFPDGGWGRTGSYLSGGDEFEFIPILPTRYRTDWYHTILTMPESDETPYRGDLFDSGLRQGKPSMIYQYGSADIWWKSFHFKTSESETQTNSATRSDSALDFADGKVTFVVESGFEPDSEIDVVILAKPIPGETIIPSIRMDGPLGVGFQLVNVAKPMRADNPESLDQDRKAITPYFVGAMESSESIALFWSPPANTNYRGVKIYRSKKRPLGDLSEIGGKIYQGYGKTNDPEARRNIERTTTETNVVTAPKVKSGSDRYLSSVPPEANAPAPPFGLKATWLPEHSEHSGLPHFIDSPPEPDSVYTYTIYGFSVDGKLGYPVFVYAKTFSNSTIRLITDSDE